MNAHTSIFRTQFDDAPADLGTEPIPAGPYYKPEYFELEREAVFRRTWLHVGHLSEIAEPGTFMVRPVEAANASILIVHGKDGRIRAFHNVCTHKGTRLVAESEGRRSSFSCRYHMWTFGYDGTLRSAPDFESFYVEKSTCGLPAVSVDVCAGLVFVNLDKNPQQSLRDFLGPYAAELENTLLAKVTTFSEYVYDIDANWKLAYDNFQEIYHLRFVHPRSGAPGYGPENPFGYPARFGFHGVHRTQSFWSNPKPAVTESQMLAFRLRIQSASGDGSQAALRPDKYYGLFPNLFIRASQTQPFSQQIVPLGPTRSRGIVRLYWIGEDENASIRYAREFAMANLRDIHAEDRDVVEGGQLGLSSGALEHIHFQAQEAPCRHLYKAVDAMVNEYKADRNAARGPE